VPFLPQYGTAYVLYDEQDNDYSYAIKSNEYRLSEYIALRVWVTGPVTDVGGQVPVMNVTRIHLLGRRRGRFTS
jgi:hypothetical protein